MEFYSCFNTASGKHYCNGYGLPYFVDTYHRFNTASGKHYCNKQTYTGSILQSCCFVSIPQAVSTIAIAIEMLK